MEISPPTHFREFIEEEKTHVSWIVLLSAFTDVSVLDCNPANPALVLIRDNICRSAAILRIALASDFLLSTVSQLFRSNLSRYHTCS